MQEYTLQSNNESLKKLYEAVKVAHSMVLSDQGYGTVGECDDLNAIESLLKDTININVCKNMPF